MPPKDDNYVSMKSAGFEYLTIQKLIHLLDKLPIPIYSEQTFGGKIEKQDIPKEPIYFFHPNGNLIEENREEENNIKRKVHKKWLYKKNQKGPYTTHERNKSQSIFYYIEGCQKTT